MIMFIVMKLNIFWVYFLFFQIQMTKDVNLTLIENLNFLTVVNFMEFYYDRFFLNTIFIIYK